MQVDKSCLNCEEACWETANDIKGESFELNTGECLSTQNDEPTWRDTNLHKLEEELQHENSIWKQRPYVNCSGWKPRSNEYDDTGWEGKNPRTFVLYGRRLPDKKGVGDVQVSFESETDHFLESDTILPAVKCDDGIEYTTVIPKRKEDK